MRLQALGWASDVASPGERDRPLEDSWLVTELSNYQG